MPTLHLKDIVIKTFEKKAEMLKKFLFYLDAISNLFDITTAIYSQKVDCPQEILKSEVWATLLKQHSDKTPEPDGIPNKVLKAVATLMIN